LESHEVAALSKVYRNLEQLILILIAVALPIFGMIYLYHNSGTLNWELPEIPSFFRGLLTGAGAGLLILQYFKFQRTIKESFNTEELLLKLKVYAKACKERFLLLFATSLISSFGLLFFQSAFFIVIFAVTLLFFSLAKPTPDRIVRLLKLSKVEADLIRKASRPK